MYKYNVIQFRKFFWRVNGIKSPLCITRLVVLAALLRAHFLRDKYTASKVFAPSKLNIKYVVGRGSHKNDIFSTCWQIHRESLF